MESLDNDAQTTLGALARFLARSRLLCAAPEDLLSDLDEAIPPSVVKEVLDELQAVGAVRLIEKTGTGDYIHVRKYAITRTGFAHLGASPSVDLQPSLIIKILRELARASIQQRVEYVTVNTMIDLLDEGFPISIISEYMSDLEQLNLVKSFGEAGAAFALTRAGFKRLKQYDDSLKDRERLSSKMVRYLNDNPHRRGDVVLWLRMEGVVKEEAIAFAERLVNEGVLRQLSDNVYCLP